jgi:hypothetical protein
MEPLLPHKEAHIENPRDEEAENDDEDAADYPYPLLVLKENLAGIGGRSPESYEHGRETQNKEGRVHKSQKPDPLPVNCRGQVLEGHAGH